MVEVRLPYFKMMTHLCAFPQANLPARHSLPMRFMMLLRSLQTWDWSFIPYCGFTCYSSFSSSPVFFLPPSLPPRYRNWVRSLRSSGCPWRSSGTASSSSSTTWKRSCRPSSTWPTRRCVLLIMMRMNEWISEQYVLVCMGQHWDKTFVYKQETRLKLRPYSFQSCTIDLENQ